MTTADPTNLNPTPLSRASIIRLQKSAYLSHPLSAANSLTALLCKATAFTLTNQVSYTRESFFQRLQQYSTSVGSSIPCWIPMFPGTAWTSLPPHSRVVTVQHPCCQGGVSSQDVIKGCWREPSEKAHPPHHSLTVWPLCDPQDKEPTAQSPTPRVREPVRKGQHSPGTAPHGEGKPLPRPAEHSLCVSLSLPSLATFALTPWASPPQPLTQLPPSPAAEDLATLMLGWLGQGRQHRDRQETSPLDHVLMFTAMKLCCL